MQLKPSDNSRRYPAVSIPNIHLPRFIKIATAKGGREPVFIVLASIIQTFRKRVLRKLIDIRSAQAWTFKISRDAALELGEGITQSHIDCVSHSLKQRTQADAVSKACL